MGDFVDAALGFPTVLFSFLLLVVVAYWVAVLAGGLDADALDADGAPDGGGWLSGVGLGGVPVSVALSLFIALAWFAALAGTALLGAAPAVPVLVLVAALVLGWAGTAALVRPLRRLLPDGRGPSRHDFVGQVCVVRTGRVDAGFGQAEVTATDGSSAVVQVRQAGADPLRAGSLALIYDFDAAGEFFWVVPADVALHPDPPRDPRSTG